MARKDTEVPYTLRADAIAHMTLEEIKVVLRAADDITGCGGRTLVTLILKGSKQHSVVKHHLDRSPAYGALAHVPLDDIRQRVDWCIIHGYLDIRYEGRLPVIIYTQKGWIMEKQTRIKEYLTLFNKMLDTGDFNLSFMKDRNREITFELLDAIEQTHEPRYIPLLDSWAATDYKKVAARIRKVITSLAGR